MLILWQIGVCCFKQGLKVCFMCLQVPAEARREHLSQFEAMLRHLLWVLGSELRSSDGSALNGGTISLAPSYVFVGQLCYVLRLAPAVSAAQVPGL